MRRVVVSIDPSGSGDAEADECGVVACGIDEADHLWVLADATLRASPQQWAAVAIKLFHNLAADRIVAEVNFGGGLVEALSRTFIRIRSHYGASCAWNSGGDGHDSAAIWHGPFYFPIRGQARREIVA
jgi:hypothetical protein